MPRLKRFLSEVLGRRVPQTLLTHKEVGHTQEAQKELLSKVSFSNSGIISDTPKPTRLIRHLLQVATPADKPCVAMDFFAGTGTMQDASKMQRTVGKVSALWLSWPIHSC